MHGATAQLSEPCSDVRALLAYKPLLAHGPCRMARVRHSSTIAPRSSQPRDTPQPPREGWNLPSPATDRNRWNTNSFLPLRRETRSFESDASSRTERRPVTGTRYDQPRLAPLRLNGLRATGGNRPARGAAAAASQAPVRLSQRRWERGVTSCQNHERRGAQAQQQPPSREGK